MSSFVSRRGLLGGAAAATAATVLGSQQAQAAAAVNGGSAQCTDPYNHPVVGKRYNPHAHSRHQPCYSNAPRDPYQWPFATTSIWNMPLGTKAKLQPLHMTVPGQGYAPDETYLVFDPNAPLRHLIERDYWWPWKDGDQVLGVDSGVQVHVPDAWVLRPPSEYNYPNRMTAMIQADGMVREFQYTVRPVPGSDVSFFEKLRAVYDLHGDGLTGPNGWGAHGGSGMTAIGGTLRAGDLVGTRPIRHALSFTVDMRKWGTPDGGGFRWPAIARDVPHAEGDYGSLATQPTYIQMGSLLALPSNLDLDRLGFVSVAGRKIAEALQGWGAYVVDTSANPVGNWDVHMIGADEDAMRECPDLVNSWGDLQTPLRADLDKIFPYIALVTNNGPDAIGGGGQPTRPLAPRFAR